MPVLYILKVAKFVRIAFFGEKSRSYSVNSIVAINLLVYLQDPIEQVVALKYALLSNTTSELC